MATIEETVESVRDLITDAEATCLASSLAIDGNKGRAFRMIWSRRLGYASHMRDSDWEALQLLAYRLGVDIPC